MAFRLQDILWYSGHARRDTDEQWIPECDSGLTNKEKAIHNWQNESFLQKTCVCREILLPSRAPTVVMNNLNIVGSRVYPVRHYLIAVRLRDRKGRAILCIALVPQSGDSSGTTLGVRSVALLHVRSIFSQCLPLHLLRFFTLRALEITNNIIEITNTYVNHITLILN